MKWNLDALKILAKEKTVPGVALQDAITEIDKLTVKLASKEVIIKSMQVRLNDFAERQLKSGETTRVNYPVCQSCSTVYPPHMQKDHLFYCPICGARL